LSETGGGVLTPELVLVSPELAKAQRQTTQRKAAMSSSEPANGTFFVDPAQPVPPPVTPEVAPPAAPAPEPVAAQVQAPAVPPAAAQAQPAPSAPMIDVPLGTLIFRAGLLAEEQLEDALQEGMRTGKRLGEVLIERGWLHERDLGRLLAGQKGLPFVEISSSDAEPGALQELPEEKAKLQVALPLRHEDGQLVVAVADPSNELMLENLRRALGAEPKLVVAPYADLVRSIGEAYGGAPAETQAPPQTSEPVAAEPVLAQPEAPQPEVQLQPQPEAQLAPPVEPEPVAEPVQPLTPPAVTPLPTVVPPAEERATEPAPAPLAPPPPVEPAPAAAQLTPPVETPTAPAIETVPPLNQQAAPEPEPVAPAAEVAPLEPEVPPVQPVQPVQPAPAPEPALQPPVAPPPAVEVPAAEVPPVAPQSAAPPVEAPTPEAPVQDEPGPVHVVVVRLRDGEALEIGTFHTAPEAATRAQELVAEITAAEGSGTWPFFAQRYLRPDSIVSVDLVEENADRWLGSAVRRSWAAQQ
jgi:hypothetical protein